MTSAVAAYWTVALLLVSASTSAQELFGEKPAKLMYTVHKLENCPEHPHPPHDYSDITIEMDPETGTLYVSGTLIATEPMEQGINGIVTIFNCLTEDERSCEKYIELEVEDFCAHLPEMNKTWTPIVSSLENFDPHCPVPPGVYELHDAPLETQSVRNKYALEGHWQAEVMVKQKGKVFACLRGDATISVDTEAGGDRR